MKYLENLNTTCNCAQYSYQKRKLSQYSQKIIEK